MLQVQVNHLLDVEKIVPDQKVKTNEKVPTVAEKVPIVAEEDVREMRVKAIEVAVSHL